MQVASLVPLAVLLQERHQCGVSVTAGDQVVVDTRQALAGVGVRKTINLELVEVDLGHFQHEIDIVSFALL